MKQKNIASGQPFHVDLTDIEINGEKFDIYMVRDNRSTAQLRRKK